MSQLTARWGVEKIFVVLGRMRNPGITSTEVLKDGLASVATLTTIIALLSVTATLRQLGLGARLRGRTLQRGRSRHLLLTPFSELLLRTLLRTFFTLKPIAGPLLRTLLRTLPQNPSQNLLRTLLRTLCCHMALRRAPNWRSMETSLSLSL